AKILIFGFKPENTELTKIMAGGGIISMVKVSCIIGISACYSGIFKGTNFLDGIQSLLVKACSRITPFGGILLTSLLASGIACNQSLAIMLTHQLCDTVVLDKYAFASYLENTAVVVAPLIPWSIAITTPLTSIEAPLFSLWFAFYLYLIPLWNFAVLLFKDKKPPDNAASISG
ncbi:MAG: Na+/H+ antiporter NhaC family protein, partial [Treponema sp.]